MNDTNTPTVNKLANVKVGDHVVLQSHHGDGDVRRVSRLTRTMIILAPENSYSRYYRGSDKTSSLKRRDYPGLSVDGLTHTRIDRIATQPEIDAHDAKIRAKALERAQRENKQVADNAKRAQLSALFNAKDAWVSIEQADTYQITITGLTEADVRFIAGKINA